MLKLDAGIPLDQRITVTIADYVPISAPEPPRDLPQQPSITDGQNVPDDIVPGDPERLADLVLKTNAL